MLRIEKFLGKEIKIPEDRVYNSRQGLWAKLEESEIVFGLTEPAIVLVGGLNDLDWLATDGEEVEEGDEIIFAITSKILYLDSPVSGTITLNYKLKQELGQLFQITYGKGWLFKVQPQEEARQVMQKFISAEEYLEDLKHTEGFKNPEGIKGGVSEICKAVYSGIREQKI